MNDKITVLVSARKNSKYLGKFLEGYRLRTSLGSNIECLVMLNDEDTWNDELVQNYKDAQNRIGIAEKNHPLRFYREDLGLGRGGLHKYFNILLENATGQWIIYFCEDHFIVMDNWDEYIRAVINGKMIEGDSAGKNFPLNPEELWVLVPKFDNCGAMNHVVSRGFINALGGVIGNHGWIDSYINDLMKSYTDRVIRFDLEMFHDFTHDKPDPMDPIHLKARIGEGAKLLPKYGGGQYESQISGDSLLIKKFLGR